MPEGDTIYRTAEHLRRVLSGARLHDASSPNAVVDAAALIGQQIKATESRGKHLLLHLGDGNAIHSHMGMTGSWHIYRPGEGWRKPQRLAALVLEVASATCVCFTPKTLELLTPLGLRGHRYLSRLGPDLLSGFFEPEQALPRFRCCDSQPLGETVMNQTVVCGIGNVYKSEILFLLKHDPFAPTAELSDHQLTGLMTEARRLMQKNLAGFRRKTRFGRDGHSLWVYGRRGEPCLICGTVIQMQRQGNLGRSTYWCPRCQRTTAPEDQA